jgi:outer membrane protein
MDPADAAFWDVELDPTEEPTGPAVLPDVDAAVAKAIEQRTDISRAQIDVDNAATSVDFLRNQRLPDVRLEASYRGNGLGGTQLVRSGGFPGDIIGTRNRGFGNVLGQAFSSDYPAWSLGVTVNYPIGRSYEEASLARAEVERRQAAQRTASLRLDAASEIRQAARQVRSTSERVEAARASETLAQDRLTSEQRRYEVGLSTTFLVTQAQRDLLQAQVNRLQTTLDYESSLVNFETLQQAPAFARGGPVGLDGASVVFLPPGAPRGVFRPSTGGIQ